MRALRRLRSLFRRCRPIRKRGTRRRKTNDSYRRGREPHARPFINRFVSDFRRQIFTIARHRHNTRSTRVRAAFIRLSVRVRIFVFFSRLCGFRGKNEIRRAARTRVAGFPPSERERPETNERFERCSPAVR